MLNSLPQVKLKGMYFLFNVKCLYFDEENCLKLLVEFDERKSLWREAAIRLLGRLKTQNLALLFVPFSLNRY